MSTSKNLVKIGDTVKKLCPACHKIKERNDFIGIRCKACNSKYQILIMQKNHKFNSDWFWGIAKPHCRMCGYKKHREALVLHHRDRSQKKNKQDSLSYWLRGKDAQKIINKLKDTNFIILCRNCHHLVHRGFECNVKHGDNFLFRHVVV